MGIEYKLYCRIAGTFLSLGKRFGSGYQTPGEEIAAFLARCYTDACHSPAVEFDLWEVTIPDDPDVVEEGWAEDR